MPTIGETIPGFGATPWYGLFAPAGTPKDIIVFMQRENERVLTDNGVQEKLALQGTEPYNLTTEQFTAIVKTSCRDGRRSSRNPMRPWIDQRYAVRGAKPVMPTSQRRFSTRCGIPAWSAGRRERSVTAPHATSRCHEPI